MNPANKEESQLSLVTDHCAWSVKDIKERVSAIREYLRKKGIGPHTRIVVFLSEEEILFPVLAALYESGITSVPLDPAAKGVDPGSVAGLCQAAYIITESRYLDRVRDAGAGAADTERPWQPASDTGVLVADREIPWQPASHTAPSWQEPFDPFLFYTEEDDFAFGRVVSQDELLDFMKGLDISLAPRGEDDLLALSRCLPFQDLVPELIWCFSRNVAVLVTTLNGQWPLSRYVRPAGRYEMGFSLFYFGSYGASAGQNIYDLLFDTVRYADNNGFDAVWTPERHFNEFGGLFPNPSVLSAALAVATSHVQLRCGSIVAPLHHSIRIAEDWSIIDNLSDGRVAISFASGWQPDDFVFFPDHYTNRHEHMLEQIDTVRRLWKGESGQFRNGVGVMTELSIYPRPVQQELPVWITVSGKIESFLDAGKAGANILTHLLWQDLDELKEKIAGYRRSRALHGFDPASGKVCVMVHTYLGLSDQAVREKVKVPLKDYFRTSTQLIRAMIKPGEMNSRAEKAGVASGAADNEIPSHLMEELLEIAFNRFYDHAGLLGTMEKCQKLVRRLKDCGADEIASLIDFGLSREDIMKGLELLSELRKEYTRQIPGNYPVTILHCTPETLEGLNADLSFSQFLTGLKMVVADTDLSAKMPLFNDAISQEF